MMANFFSQYELVTFINLLKMNHISGTKIGKPLNKTNYFNENLHL